MGARSDHPGGPRVDPSLNHVGVVVANRRAIQRLGRQLGPLGGRLIGLVPHADMVEVMHGRTFASHAGAREQARHLATTADGVPQPVVLVGPHPTESTSIRRERQDTGVSRQSRNDDVIRVQIGIDASSPHQHGQRVGEAGCEQQPEQCRARRAGRSRGAEWEQKGRRQPANVHITRPDDGSWRDEVDHEKRRRAQHERGEELRARAAEEFAGGQEDSCQHDGELPSGEAVEWRRQGERFLPERSKVWLAHGGFVGHRGDRRRADGQRNHQGEDEQRAELRAEEGRPRPGPTEFQDGVPQPVDAQHAHGQQRSGKVHEQQEGASQTQPQPRSPAAAVSPRPPVCEPEEQQGHTEREVLEAGQVVPGEAAQHADQRPAAVGGSRGAKQHVHAGGQEQQRQDRQDAERARRPQHVDQGDASKVRHDAGGRAPFDDQPAGDLSSQRTIEEYVTGQVIDDILVWEVTSHERHGDVGQDRYGQQPLFQGSPGGSRHSCHVRQSSGTRRGRGDVFGNDGAGWQRSEALPESVRRQCWRRKGQRRVPVPVPFGRPRP